MSSSRKRSNERQNKIREELLEIIKINIDATGIPDYIKGMCTESYLMGIRHFKNRLDLHNKCLFDNLKSQVDAINNKMRDELMIESE